MKKNNGKMVNNVEGRKKYDILEESTMGICLLGSDIRGLKANKVDISKAWITIIDKELYIVNMRIPGSSIVNEEGKKQNPNRKLLEHREALDKMIKRVFKERLAIVPLELSLNEDGKLKVTVGLGRKNPEYVPPVKKAFNGNKKFNGNNGGKRSFHKNQNNKFHRKG